MLIKLNEVKARTGLSRSSIYAYIDKGIFPAQVKLGGCPRIRYSNDYLLMGFRKNLNYPDAKLQIDQILHSFLLKLVHIGLIQSIFTYIAGFTVKFPNSGRINPVIMALAIFLKLCAAQTIENSPATFSLPRTLKPRKPLFLI